MKVNPSADAPVSTNNGDQPRPVDHTQPPRSNGVGHASYDPDSGSSGDGSLVASRGDVSVFMVWWQWSWLVWAAAVGARSLVLATNFQVLYVVCDVVVVSAGASLALVAIPGSRTPGLFVWQRRFVVGVCAVMLAAVPMRMLADVLALPPGGADPLLKYVGGVTGAVWVFGVCVSPSLRFGLSRSWWWLCGGLWLIGWVSGFANVTLLGLWGCAVLAGVCWWRWRHEQTTEQCGSSSVRSIDNRSCDTDAPSPQPTRLPDSAEVDVQTTSADPLGGSSHDK